MGFSGSKESTNKEDTPINKVDFSKSPTLKVGSSGEYVLKLQNHLKSLGFFSGNVDGKFGPITKNSVMKFQESVGLSADGVVGKNTKAKLSEAVPDRPSVPPEYQGEAKEPTFVVVKGVRFKDRGNYKTPSGKFMGLTVHYTVSGRTESSARGVLQWLAEQGYGCMVMDQDGKIYIPEGFDVLKSWGYHSGVSRWAGRSSVSDVFAGMEICCWGKGSSVGPFRESSGEGNIIAGRYQQYTQAQEDSLVNFILWAKSKNSEFKIENVVGHDELRAEAGKRGDKQDPGASLSMTMPQFRKMLKEKIEAGSVTPKPTPVDPSTRVFGSWELGHPERSKWTDKIVELFKSNFALFSGAKDVTEICPKFHSLTDRLKLKLLTEFWIAVAYYESGYNPKSSSVDVGSANNRNTYSDGLYQMSGTDSSAEKFGYDYKKLLEPIPNIEVALEQLRKQVVKEGVFFLPNSSSMRYWAVILKGNTHNKIPQIIDRVKRNAPECY